MYSNKIATEQLNSSSKYLATGIHDNVLLQSIRIDKSPAGNQFIEFTFGKDGAIVTHTEWEPSKFNGMTDADLQVKQNNLYNRVKQIMRCYYSEDVFDNFECNTFNEFITFVKSTLDAAAPTPVRLKVVYNDKGYTTLPTYSKYKFIEPMSVEKSELKREAIDKFERPIVADKETTKDPLAVADSSKENVMVGSEKNSDPSTVLPF